MNTYNPFDNPDFRKELGEMFDDKLAPIAEKVSEHERTLQRAWGVRAALAFVWTAILGFSEYLFHKN